MKNKFRKGLVVGIVCLLLLVTIPLTVGNVNNDEPQAKIIIRRALLFGDLWVEVQDIREERPYKLPFNWTLQTSKIFMIIGFDIEGFFHWEDPRIETRKGVIGDDLTETTVYNLWGTSTFEIDVYAGNVEKHAVGFVVLGKIFIFVKR